MEIRVCVYEASRAWNYVQFQRGAGTAKHDLTRKSSLCRRLGGFRAVVRLASQCAACSWRPCVHHREQDAVVGHCIYCQAPHDVFGPDDVCTVCRECVLICHPCKTKTVELHCEDHMKVCMRFACLVLGLHASVYLLILSMTHGTRSPCF